MFSNSVIFSHLWLVLVVTMLIWINCQLKDIPESLIVRLSECNVRYHSMYILNNIAYTRWTFHMGNNTNSCWTKKGVQYLRISFLHLCLVYILCNEMVMYLTFPFYSSDLKDTFLEKGIAQLKDGWLSCPITLNVQDFIKCLHEFPHLYLHGVLPLDGNKNQFCCVIL